MKRITLICDHCKSIIRPGEGVEVHALVGTDDSDYRADLCPSCADEFLTSWMGFQREESAEENVDSQAEEEPVTEDRVKPLKAIGGYYCGRCNKAIRFLDRFCCSCGQEADWS